MFDLTLSSWNTAALVTCVAGSVFPCGPTIGAPAYSAPPNPAKSDTMRDGAAASTPTVTRSPASPRR
jgi:hypothetical protein